MDLLAYTVFYCEKHNKFILVDNIHKTIPNYFQNLDNCENNDLLNIGYITINNGFITDDTMIENMSFNINYNIISSSNKDEIVKDIIAWLNMKIYNIANTTDLCL